jgi:hypothetical protein
MSSRYNVSLVAFLAWTWHWAGMAAALVLTVAAAVAMAQDQGQPPTKKVTVEVHDGHFVKNTFKAPQQGAFLVLANYDEFERVFGVGFVMKAKFKLVTRETFNTRTVVAVVRQVPNQIVEFAIGGAEAKGEQLLVNFTSTAKAATFQANSAMILSVPRGDYKEIVFVENGKRVASVPLGK